MLNLVDGRVVQKHAGIHIGARTVLGQCRSVSELGVGLHSADNSHRKINFQTAIALLFPPRCVSCGVFVEQDFGLCATCWAETEFLGEEVCDSCGKPMPGAVAGAGMQCDACRADSPPWTQGRSAFLYEGVGRKLVLALKHGDRTDIARPAALWLAQAAKPILKEDVLVVPVPLHRLRFLRRRYNQAAVLAKALSIHLKLAYCPDALVRRRGIGSLEGLGAQERRKKLSNAVFVHPRRKDVLNGAHVLLVDDVLTSGATLRAATTACLQANAKDVSVLTLARVAKGT